MLVLTHNSLVHQIFCHEDMDWQQQHMRSQYTAADFTHGPHLHFTKKKPVKTKRNQTWALHLCVQTLLTSQHTADFTQYLALETLAKTCKTQKHKTLQHPRAASSSRKSFILLWPNSKKTFKTLQNQKHPSKYIGIWKFILLTNPAICIWFSLSKTQWHQTSHSRPTKGLTHLALHSHFLSKHKTVKPSSNQQFHHHFAVKTI